jgi:hypothetical protein
LNARLALIALLFLVISGACAARLSQPVRLREAEPWLVKKTTVSERAPRSGASQCVREVTLEIVHLPGAAYALDVRPGLFASSEFSVTLHESGTLKQLSLNSDPQVDETLEAAGALGEKLAGAAAKIAPIFVSPSSEILPGPGCPASADVKLAPLACFAEPRPAELDPARCPAAGSF